MGIAFRHSGPDSVFTVRENRKHLAAAGVSRIEIPVTHEALFFISFCRGIGVCTKNAVVCDRPYSTVGGCGRLGVLIKTCVLHLFGDVLCVVNSVAVNELLKVFNL